MRHLERVVALVWKATVFGALLVSFSMLILQVISRYIFNFPIIWTNEIATIAFMWLIFIGAIGAVYDGDMIRLNMIVVLFGKRTAKIFEISFQVLFIVAACISIPYSFIIVEKMHILKFDITGIPFSYFYFSGLCFFVTCIPCCAKVIWRIVKTGRAEREDPLA